LQKAETIAAELASVIFGNSIGSMVANDIVNAITQKFNPAAIYKLASFL
jgi:uncharacterized protein (DUF2062 family)